MFHRRFRSRGPLLTERGQGLAVLLGLLALVFLLILKAKGAA